MHLARWTPELLEQTGFSQSLYIAAYRRLIDAFGEFPRTRAFLNVGQYQGQRSVDAVLRQRPPVFRIPVHDYEMMHEGGGNRTSPWFTGPGRQAFDRHQAMPLFWGESFHLTRARWMLPVACCCRRGSE